MTTVIEGRDAYLAANGFSIDGYSKPTAEFPIFGRPVTFPNPPARRRAVSRHDLHHALTGYGTDYAGEAEIGAWSFAPAVRRRSSRRSTCSRRRSACSSRRAA
jgi:hypothetical protein